MNTKTMRLPPRRVLTSNKRKDRDGFDSLKSSPLQPPAPSKLAKPIVPQFTGSNSSNQLLAGYLAHEFLTNGTLFGQPWDQPQAESGIGSDFESKHIKPSHKGKAAEPINEKVNYQRYVEISGLLKGEEGAHIPGVVNPTQLARFLQI